MPIYTVTYLNADGTTLRQQKLRAENDDKALDHVGESKHRHAIDVRHGDRHVVRFPPWPRGLG